MMTRSDADKLWCPFAMTSPEIIHCVSGKCMAWRWERLSDQQARSKTEAIRKYRNTTGATFMEAKDYIEAHTELWPPQPEENRLGRCALIPEGGA